MLTYLLYGDPAWARTIQERISASLPKGVHACVTDHVAKARACFREKRVVIVVAQSSAGHLLFLKSLTPLLVTYGSSLSTIIAMGHDSSHGPIPYGVLEYNNLAAVSLAIVESLKLAVAQATPSRQM